MSTVLPNIHTKKGAGAPTTHKNTNNNNTTNAATANADARNDNVYVCTCAALGVKPNSRVLKMATADVEGKPASTYSSVLTTASSLDFSNNYIGGLGFQAVSVVLSQHNKGLETINASGNGLTNESVVYFCRAMMKGSAALPLSATAGSGDEHSVNISSASADGTIHDDASSLLLSAGTPSSSSLPCPLLRSINLSNNPISLPAATAILQLATALPALEEVCLSDTHVDAQTLTKISRVLNLKLSRKNEKLHKLERQQHQQQIKAAAVAAIAHQQQSPPQPPLQLTAVQQQTPTTTTPFQKVLSEQKVKASDIRIGLEKKRCAEEEDKLAQLASFLSSPNAKTATTGVSYAIAPTIRASVPRSLGGFIVLNIAISTTPSDFTSELRMLYDVILPSLNSYYGRTYRIVLNPTSMFMGTHVRKYTVGGGGGGGSISTTKGGGRQQGNAEKGGATALPPNSARYLSNVGNTNKSANANKLAALSSTPFVAPANTISGVPPAFTAKAIAAATATMPSLNSVAAAAGRPSSSSSPPPPPPPKIATRRYQPVAITSDFIANITTSNRGGGSNIVTPFFLQLLGEKVGLPRIGPSSSASSSASPLSPILEEEYAVGVSSSLAPIVMIRAPTTTMAVPPPLLPLLSDDCRRVHPDEHTRAIREAVATVRGSAAGLSSSSSTAVTAATVTVANAAAAVSGAAKAAGGSNASSTNSTTVLLDSYFDIDLEKQKWARHVAFVSEVRSSHPYPLLLCDGYRATFEGVDASGNVLLSGLDTNNTSSSSTFRSMLERRLKCYLDHIAAGIYQSTAVNTAATSPIADPYLFTPHSPVDNAATALAVSLQTSKGVAGRGNSNTNNNNKSGVAAVIGGVTAFNVPLLHSSLSLRMPFFLARAAPLGRRTIAGKLDLYTITPPSRNITLLHSGGIVSVPTTSAAMLTTTAATHSQQHQQMLMGPSSSSSSSSALSSVSVGGFGVSTTLKSFVHKALRKPQQHFLIVAHHSTTDVTMFAEPSDPKTMFLNLICQLNNATVRSQYVSAAVSSNATNATTALPVPEDLPAYLVNEVSVEKIRDHFIATLARVSSDYAASDASTIAAAAASNANGRASVAAVSQQPAKTIIIVIDALDRLDEMIIPCASLKISDTGANLWDPSAALVTTSANNNNTAAAKKAAGGSAPSGASLVPTPPPQPPSSSSTAGNGNGGVGVSAKPPPSRVLSAAAPSPPASPNTNNTNASPTADPYSFIPMALPRNVRLIASCQSLSTTHKMLELRGHDACDALGVGPLADYEVEQFINSVIVAAEEAGGLGLQLGEATKANLLAKEDSRSYAYLKFIVAACERYRDTQIVGGGRSNTTSATAGAPSSASSARGRQQQQQQHGLTVDSFVEAVSPTLVGACTDLCVLLENTFAHLSSAFSSSSSTTASGGDASSSSAAFVRRALGLLLASRNGLTLIELGDLLSPSAYASSSSSSSPSPILPLSGDELQKLVRLLKPVLADTVPTTAITAGSSSPSPSQLIVLNSLEGIIHIDNVTFRDVATARYRLDNEGVATHHHHVLAHYYRRLMLQGGDGDLEVEDDEDEDEEEEKGKEKKSGDADNNNTKTATPFFEQQQQLPSPSPLRAKACIACAYHVTAGKLWALLDRWIFSIAFVMRCYQLKVGYQCLRELVRAYNTVEKTMSTAAPASGAHAANNNSNNNGLTSLRSVLLAKGKEYVYFARDHSVNLTMFPHMGYQIAITTHTDTFLYRDAKAYFTLSSAASVIVAEEGEAPTTNSLGLSSALKKTRKVKPHFVATAKSKAKVHREAITCVTFAPSGLRFATCSDDRTIKIFTASGNSGGSADIDGKNQTAAAAAAAAANTNEGHCLFTINASAVSKIKRLVYSASSRYLVAASEDRTTYVYDASSSHLISKFYGHSSIIRDVAVSNRGRFIATASDDKHLKIWEAETGALCVSVPHTAYAFAAAAVAASSSAAGYGYAVSRVVCDPYDELVFYVTCFQTIVGWRMNLARDSVEKLFAVNVVTGKSAVDASDESVVAAAAAASTTNPISSLQLTGDGHFLITCLGYPALSSFSSSSSSSSASSSASSSSALVRMWDIRGCGEASSPEQRANKQSPSQSSPRLAAELVLPSSAFVGSSFAALSPDERILSVALVDGTVAVYALGGSVKSELINCTSTATAKTAPLVISPAAIFSCFAHHPSIHIQHLVYSHDSTMLAVTGNVRQIKVMDLKKVSGGLNNAGSGKNKEDEERKASSSSYHAIVAEYLLDSPLVSVSWSPNPQEGAPELLIGDAVGRLHALRLEKGGY